jgi:hypothetical protein
MAKFTGPNPSGNASTTNNHAFDGIRLQPIGKLYSEDDGSIESATSPSGVLKDSDNSDGKQTNFAGFKVKESMDLESLRNIVKLSSSKGGGSKFSMPNSESSGEPTGQNTTSKSTKHPFNSSNGSSDGVNGVKDVNRTSANRVPSPVSGTSPRPPKLQQHPQQRSPRLPSLDLHSDDHTSFDMLFDQFSQVASTTTRKHVSRSKKAKSEKSNIGKFEDTDKLDNDLAQLLRAESAKFNSSRDNVHGEGPRRTLSGKKKNSTTVPSSDEGKGVANDMYEQFLNGVHIPTSGFRVDSSENDLMYDDNDDDEEGIQNVDDDEEDDGIDWVSVNAVRPDKLPPDYRGVIHQENKHVQARQPQQQPHFTFGRGLAADDDEDDDHA